VSKSLVSLVMRGAPNVSDARRAAVLDAAAELGYRPNAVARSLVRQRSHVIGIVLSDVHNPFYADIVDGIDARALEREYRALFSTGKRVAEQEAVALDTLLQLRVDGVILGGPTVELSVVEAAAGPVPVVVVARRTRSKRIDCVTNDDRAGAALAVEHLVGLGHRRIAHIGAKGPVAKSRRTGYEQAMRQHRLASHIRCAAGDWDEPGGADGMSRLLASGEPPSAVFVANDLAAMGALNVLADHGFRVPEDVSVVGYDNTSLAALESVRLTTIDQPRAEMGSAAVDLLLERLEEGRTRPKRIVLRPALVVRSTTTSPPATVA
jgi:DNA-binding LacI/PurR family transcriptional regulator